MKKNDSPEKILELLKNARNIALFTHSRPDGDAIGSTLALKSALERMGKKAFAFCDTEIGHKYDSLGFGKFFSDTPRGNFDLYVALDCGDSGRLGDLSEFFLKQTNTLSIDHHYSHISFSKYNYVVDCSSTCELVYKLLKLSGTEIDAESARLLYIGLSTDTGNFSHSNTTSEVFEIASSLAEKGIDIADLYDKLYASSRFERTRLLGRVLGRIRRYYDGRLCLIYVTKEDFDATGTKKDDTEGFIDYTINVKGARIGVSICEHSPYVYKVSMRSKGENISEVCAHFGGGGHVQAAGCMISGFFEDVVDKLLKAVRDIVWMDL